MNRIEKTFQQLKQNNRKALITFITAGDPDLGSTVKYIHALEEGGADIIELGVPFSDPLADGPVIQKASLRSLKSGTTLKKIIQTVRRVRKNSSIPVILMSSYNPIFRYGEETFVKDSIKAGVDGIIVPDLPPEEATSLCKFSKNKGLDMIFLLAPTSTDERIKIVSRISGGFIYYVSLTGVTGTREKLSKNLKANISKIKRMSSKPVAIGFGISNPGQAAFSAGISDGAIIGSAIVKIIEKGQENSKTPKNIKQFVHYIKKAVMNS
jgi:tryptophan synthase alpha chain